MVIPANGANCNTASIITCGCLAQKRLFKRDGRETDGEMEKETEGDKAGRRNEDIDR